jgi:hypothetical protein
MPASRCRVTDIWTNQPTRVPHYARGVTPLQKVAMGLVIVVVSARFGGYDALPDPVGWALIVGGLLPLRTGLPLGGWALALAVAAGLVAVPLWLPVVADRVSASGQWGAGLPQTLCCLVLCIGLALVAGQAGDREAVRFRLLRWAFVVVAAGPVLVYGGDVDALAAPLAVLAVLTNVAFVYYLFKVSRRGYGGTTAGAPSAHG